MMHATPFNLVDRRAKPQPNVVRERVHALDAVRAFALLIGVVLHGVESFVTYIPPYVWAVKDSQSSWVIDSFFYAAHVFRMQAFFLVAGFFAHYLYHSRGAQGFLNHRLKRIGLPLVLFWPIIFIAIQLVWTWGYQRMGYLAQNPATATLGFWQVVGTSLASRHWLDNGFPFAHLWFLYMLLWFCGAVLLVRPLMDRVADRGASIRRGVDYFLAFTLRRWWGILLLGLLCMPAMWGMKNGFGVDTPDFGLLPKWAPLLLYGFYFTVGWFLHRQKELLHQVKNYWRQYLAMSLFMVGFLTVAFLAVVYHSAPVGQLVGIPSFPLAPWMLNGLYGVASMTVVFAFLGVMLVFCARPSPSIRYLSDASYWLYLVHLPLVVAFQIMVASYAWHWVIKLAVIFVGSFSVLLLSYHYLVRSTWIGQLLNGRMRWSRNGGQKQDVYFFCYGNQNQRGVDRQTAQIRRGLQGRGPAPG